MRVIAMLRPAVSAIAYSHRRVRCGGIAVALVVLLCGVTATANDKKPKPAEEERFSSAAFRAGLRKRGLFEFLDLHLKEFPPSGKTATLLMRRDLKLAEFHDASRPREERMASVAEANRLLGQLITENPKDRRRFDWQFALGHSLLYDEAESFFTNILYRGGGPADRRRLRPLTTRAVATLTALTEQFASEYEILDNLPIAKFERLERAGYVDELDRLAPQAEYLLLWALLYDSLSRDDTDPTRASRLNRIRASLAENRALLNLPHEISRVQVQAMLLAGVTSRLLNDHADARRHLDRALYVAQRSSDPAEQERIRWAITLACIERIRNDRDDSRFDDAIKGVDRFRKSPAGGDASDDASDFGLQIVAALLERSIHRARANDAERNGQVAEARRYRDRAWKPLEGLISGAPGRCDEVYATVYELIGQDADPTAIDPFDQCALVAGLLLDAQRDPAQSAHLQERAIRVGERFIAAAPDAARSLVPAMLYNVAVAHYRQGQQVRAAERFLEVARHHPTFSRASDAATFAVQLASSVYEDAREVGNQDIQHLYLDALEVLLTKYTHIPASRYWRFHYAQLLDELGRYDAAATQFALVDPEHEHFIESAFLRTRSTALGLQESCAKHPEDLLGIQRRVNDFFTVHREFISRASGELNREPSPARTALLRGLVGRGKLVAAEVRVLPQVDRPAPALEGVEGFEATYPDLAGLTGRVWRVRLLAYERLGRLDEAARAIPAYVAADPENAGPAMQSLYFSLSEDVKRLRAAGDEEAAGQKAEIVLLLAQQVDTWARTHTSATASAERLMLKEQLAEANLLAERYERARELFEELRTGGDAPSSNVSVLLGYAESLYQLGEFGKALPEFNAMAMRLPETDPLRWKALLRDLQCRTALDQPPRDVIKVIEQQKYLFPELGGPRLADEFEKLLRENERRAGGE